mmetsp:Transcript_42670/g.166525  ORF Transcript_42670/g.166525 Transcript_42670/m.166525 type:complete len:125 (+) Transcript_42670:5087-5461(+)
MNRESVEFSLQLPCAEACHGPVSDVGRVNKSGECTTGVPLREGLGTLRPQCLLRTRPFWLEKVRTEDRQPALHGPPGGNQFAFDIEGFLRASTGSSNEHIQKHEALSTKRTRIAESNSKYGVLE